MCSGMTIIGLRIASPPLLRRSSIKHSKLRKKHGTLTLHSSHLAPTSTSFLKDCRQDRVVWVNATERNDDEGGVIIPEDYLQGEVESVTEQDRCGVLTLRIRDAHDTVLYMFIGNFESSQLLQHIKEKDIARPMAYDFMRNTLRSLGFRITQIRVTALVGHTYHARVYYKARDSSEEISVDARPSDAVNMAVRFNAPLFVHKDVVYRMGKSPQRPRQRSEVEIVRSCREEISLHQDPTVMLKLRMQMAISEEKYTAAAELRDQIDKLLASDRAMGLVVALESALNGGRYDEALQIRDQLRQLRGSRGGSEKHTSH